MTVNNVDKIRIGLDKFLDYIPGLSFLNNLTNLFEKVVYRNENGKSAYHDYLNKKSWKECGILLIPIVNIVYKIWQRFQAKETPALQEKSAEDSPSALHYSRRDISPLAQTQSQPFFSLGDDLFENGTMKVRGACVSLDEAEKTCTAMIKKYNLFPKQLHHAQLFHGSCSSSLIAFTSYNKNRGALIPTGKLEQEGLVPFTGEIAFGRSGINTKYLSTVWIRSLEVALSYAGPYPSPKQTQWSVEIGKTRVTEALKAIEQSVTSSTKSELINLELRERLKTDFNKAKETNDFSNFHDTCHEFVQQCRERRRHPAAGMGLTMQLNIFEINRKRITEWNKLNDSEKSLILEPFPVVYGIRSDRKNVHFPAYSDCSDEICLLDGAQPKEIKVIFVPPEKVTFVKKLLHNHHHFNVFVEAFTDFPRPMKEEA